MKSCHPHTVASTPTQNLRCVLAAVVFALCLLGSASAQTLARPHWAGSGMTTEPWWKHAIFYEIYPRSFQDSNGDGIGDLNGITQRLDYLQSLGIDAIWLTPIYPSPQVDFGYDVSDYTAIDPQYGTIDDFDHLVQEAGRRHIHILMDMVLNHTSDQHPWFHESAASRDNPKRDWYIWRDGKPGPGGEPAPPNNWQSTFGHSAWQFDPRTGQFYYHFFYPEQPDLNWRNPAVEAAMFAAVRFWLNRGVAGFRLDAINTLFESPDLQDAVVLPGKNAFGDPNTDQSLQTNLPEVHGVMRDLRKLIDSTPGQRVLIGEVYTEKPQELARWYGVHRDELQLPMDTQLGFLDKLDAAAFRAKLTDAQTQLGGNMPLFVFDNHDRPRSWDRYGDGTHNAAIARVIATIQLASQSAALLYYGQELGMVTTDPARKEDVKDPIGLIGWPLDKGRDGERTPMQWDATANAGFTTAVKPWLPIPPSAVHTNVAAAEDDPHSLLNWYRQLIELRHGHDALLTGTQTMLDEDSHNALVWVRQSKSASLRNPPILIACNLSAQPVTLALKPQLQRLNLRGTFLRTVLRSDDAMGPQDLNAVTLPPFGIYIGELQR